MKKKKVLEVCQTITALMMFIGIILICINETGSMAAIAIILIIIGTIGCIVCSFKLESLTERPEFSEEELLEMIDQLDKPRENRGNVNAYPEYTFIQYLKDSDSSLKEFIQLIDENEDPKGYIIATYNHYKACARGHRVQSMELVLSMIWRERRRTDEVT